MIDTMAYVNVWDSAYNESHQFYLPIQIHNQQIAEGIHQAVCEELQETQTDWDLINCMTPFPHLFVITWKSTTEENVMVYSVKFSY